jgi:hypothetical protein
VATVKLPDTFEHFLKKTGVTLFEFQREFALWLFLLWRDRRDPIKHSDGAVKMARQVGKTTITAVWLAYIIIMYRAQIVIISTKQQKTKKMARLILKFLRATGERLETKGVEEARFEDDAGFVCLSGTPESQRESETADIVLVDEAQDIEFESVYHDVGPMTAMTGGFILSIGIGGTAWSFGEQMFDKEGDGVRTMTVPWYKIAEEAHRTQHPALVNQWLPTMERDRVRMTPIDFAAHYGCERIPDTSYALLPNIYLWNNVYPDRKFDPMDAYDLRVGLDWGKRADSSALIAVAHLHGDVGTDYVMYGYGHFQCGYDQQLEEITKILKGEMPWQVVDSELNGVSEPMVDFLRQRLGRPGVLHEFSADKLGKSDALKSMNRASNNGRMLYVDDGRLAAACVKDLRAIGMKYTESDVIKATHSDWGAALLATFYQKRIAKVG